MRKILYILAVLLLLPACGENEKQHIAPNEAESGKTAGKKSARLFDAVHDEDIRTLNEMLAAGTDIEGRDEEGCTPLLLAVSSSSTEIIEILIAAGADVNSKYVEPEKESEVDEPERPMLGIIDGYIPYDDGETALHFVARDGDATLARQLLKNGAKLDIKDADGQIPLVEAVLGDNLELVKLLVSRGANLGYRDDNGRTLLHIIADSMHLFTLNEDELVEFLMAKGISPNATDNNGKTPLHAAAEKGASQFAEFLIENGANVNPADSDDYTPLDLALKKDRPHCILLLHRHNGRTSKEIPANIPEAVMMEDIEKIRSLISQGKDVNEAYTYGDTGLHYAAEKGRLDIARLLISNGAHPDKKNKIGHTPFYEAVSNNHLPVCRLLVEHDADVNVESCDGGSPLHKAVVNGNLAICKLLVKNGADLNKKDDAVRDYPGRTPLDWAIHKGHKEIERLLRSHGAKTGKELQEADK